MSSAQTHEISFDLLLKGGRVIDPAKGRDGLFDVALPRRRSPR